MTCRTLFDCQEIISHSSIRMDDVRTPVRDRGETLGRGVKALTTRLCDPTTTDILKNEMNEDAYLTNAQRRKMDKKNEATAKYAATVSLGWLVKYGLNQ